MSWSIQFKCNHKHFIYKCLTILLFLLIVNVYFSSTKTLYKVRVYDHSKPRTCYNVNNYGESIDLLEDVLASKLLPGPGSSILFHETSCQNGIISMNARQACAIESAARNNPNTNVFVLFASPVGFVKNGTNSRIVDAILSYDNVHLRNLNLWTYVKDTPSNEFLLTNKIFHSKYLTSHLSDFLRYVSLYKWGGTYVDLDVIVKQNLDLDSYKNYAVAESMGSVGSAMMHFDNGAIGNSIALNCLQDFEIHFDGKAWGTNGPGVITRVLKGMCDSNYTSMMTRERCHGFMVLKSCCKYIKSPTVKLNWKYFFDENYTDYVLSVTNHSIAVHLWNKLSASELIRVGSNTAHELLARDYCPRVYGSCGDYF